MRKLAMTRAPRRTSARTMTYRLLGEPPVGSFSARLVAPWVSTVRGVPAVLPTDSSPMRR